jgi:hypothetical protein
MARAFCFSTALALARVASPTAVPHDPREFEREDRDGRHDDNDVHHFSLTLVCPLVLSLSVRFVRPLIEQPLGFGAA